LSDELKTLEKSSSDQLAAVTERCKMSHTRHNQLTWTSHTDVCCVVPACSDEPMCNL